MKQRVSVIVNPLLLERHGKLNDFSSYINELNGLGVWVNNGIEYDDENRELTEKIKRLTELSCEGLIFKHDNSI